MTDTADKSAPTLLTETVSQEHTTDMAEDTEHITTHLQTTTDTQDQHMGIIDKNLRQFYLSD